MTEQEVWTVDELCARADAGAVVVADPAVRERVGRSLPFKCVGSVDALPETAATIIAVGGGMLLDAAKAWRGMRAPAARLIAVPSIWGSGAEVSPITVLNRDGRKEIHIEPSWVPDVRVRWDELAEGLPEHLVTAACGDVWSHALEGFLSPLGTEDLRCKLATVITNLLAMPLTADPRWFEVSALACSLQAKASVGLVHGIAHTIEGPVAIRDPLGRWGHARLCATLLLPVMHFNLAQAEKPREMLNRFGLAWPAIEPVLQRLHLAGSYESVLRVMMDEWPRILRDPSSRTNCVLVRPGTINFFKAFRADQVPG